MDWQLLRDVSRSFYLTIRVLPAPVREPIALGYLLARASDSIADTSSAEVSLRRGALEALRQGIADPEVVGKLSLLQSNDAERTLVTRLPEFLECARNSPDRERLEWVWERILRGQIFDLTRFGSDRTPLTAQELDEYAFLVAGCVGEFWTRLCAERLPRFSQRDPDALSEDARRYGKGLQLVNILRDRTADAANGRIYIPDDYFEEAKRIARDHLDAGWRWVRAVDCGRVRFACTIPLRIGSDTLAKITSGSGAVKISRSRVRWILLRSIPALWSRP